MPATTGIEQVDGGEGLVHAHQHFVAAVPAAMRQRQVQAAAVVAEGVAFEGALRRVQHTHPGALDQRLVAAAVADKVGDRADLQAMLAREDFQVRQARHRAVVLHHLADHCSRLQPGHARQVAACFGMAGAHQHAAVLCLQREDVAGLHQVAGHCIAGDSGRDRARAIRGRDAGGHAAGRLDRDGEGGAMACAVARGHRRQLQAFAAFARQSQADQAARVTRHEVDRFRRDVLGGKHEVALVLAVFLVDEDDHAAGGQLGDQLWNRGDRHGRDCRRRPCGALSPAGQPEVLPSMRST